MKNKHCLLLLMTLLAAILPLSANGDNGNMPVVDNLAPPFRDEVTLNFVSLGVGAMPFSGGLDWKKPEMAWCYDFGATVTHLITTNFGFLMGAEFTYTQFLNSANDIQSTTRGRFQVANGDESRWVDCMVKANTEKMRDYQTYFLMQVPIQLSFNTRRFFINAGFTACFPITTFSSYNYSESTFRIHTFDDLGVSVDKEPVAVNVVEGRSGDYYPSEVKVPIFCNLAVDMGWKLYFNTHNVVSFGLFARMSLNKCVINHGTVQLIDITEGVFNGKTTDRNPMESGMVDYMRFYQFGVRLAYHIGTGISEKMTPDTK